MQFPNMFTVKQNFPREGITDITGEIQKVLSAFQLEKKIKPGQKVAITAGSRGISNIILIIRETVHYLKKLRARPFVLAAMGSHGGGTVEGQLNVLARLGITEESTGAPVLAAGETVSPCNFEGNPVHINRLAYESDAIIVVNRVKPHTSFHGPNESGLIKMIAVGLGGPLGAAVIHGCGASSLPRIIPGIAQVMQQHLPIIMGLAVIEDAYENTKNISALAPEDIAFKEAELLKEAYASMPSLPVKNIDLLIVEEMGKCFSGTGMDTNIIGRLRIQGLPEPSAPSIKRIVVLDLAGASHGNAHGLGLADFTTQKLVDKIDYKATYLNAITSTFVQRAMIPITLPSDRAAIEAALKSLGAIGSQLRAARIHNTLHITELQISKAVVKDLPGRCLLDNNCPKPLSFDAQGNLLPF